MLAKFLGLNPKGPYLSLEEQKDSTDFIKRECEIRKFHFAAVQRRQRNVQYSVCTCKFVVLSIKTFYFFAVLLPSPSSLVLLSSRNSATMVT